MFSRYLVVGVLVAGCARPPAGKPQVQPTRAATPSAPVAASAPAPVARAGEAVEFSRDVEPILSSRCRPCHFEGGKVYGRLPFDRPATIRSLGEKLFTRIKDEPSQSTIRAFLARKP
jgi:hypothetical protein